MKRAVHVSPEWPLTPRTSHRARARLRRLAMPVRAWWSARAIVGGELTIHNIGGRLVEIALTLRARGPMKRSGLATVPLALALLGTPAIAHVGTCMGDSLLSGLSGKIEALTAGNPSATPVIDIKKNVKGLLWTDPKTQKVHLFLLTHRMTLPIDSITILVGNDGSNNPIFCSGNAYSSNPHAAPDDILDSDGSIRIDKLGFTGAVEAIFNIDTSTLSGWGFPHPTGHPNNGHKAILIKWRPPGAQPGDPDETTYPASFAKLMDPTLSRNGLRLTLRMSNIPGLIYDYKLRVDDPSGKTKVTDPKIVNQ